MEILFIFRIYLSPNIEVCIIPRSVITVVCNFPANLSNSFQTSIWIPPHSADQDESLPIVCCTSNIVTWLKCILFYCQGSKPLWVGKIMDWSPLKPVHVLLFIFNEIRNFPSQSVIEKNHFILSSCLENPDTTTVSW